MCCCRNNESNPMSMPSWAPLSSGEFRTWVAFIGSRFEAVEQKIEKLGSQLSASQSDIDALTQSVLDLTNAVIADDSALQSAVAGIAAEVEQLKALGVDVSGLQAQLDAAKGAVADLGDAVGSVSALVPAPVDNGGGDAPVEDAPAA